MATSFEALARSYDHVVVDAGAVAGPELEAIGEIAPHAILLAETLSDGAHASAREQLLAAGFEDVTVLVGAAPWRCQRSRRRVALARATARWLLVLDAMRPRWQRIVNQALE